MSRKPWEVHEAEFLTSAVRRQGYPRAALPQAAFAGRSNVGKSSLINCLARRQRLAKTSSTPGHTQMINFFLINGQWHWVDLPGYGYAKAPPSEQEKWRRMIEEYLTRNPNLRLLVMLLDARRAPSELDDHLVEFAQQQEIATLPVLTKCDKLKRGALTQTQREIARHYHLGPDLVPIATSASKKTGREELLRVIHDALEPSDTTE
ncbi:YihA family ribosome biogenesis GTP-binding protein [Candidatus Sumerlaeota bacterium]|nr:YihA family ribosome biogenesis GTP-binding protein [Candidatus Sumerlaeota bacterium]